MTKYVAICRQVGPFKPGQLPYGNLSVGSPYSVRSGPFRRAGRGDQVVDLILEGEEEGLTEFPASWFTIFSVDDCVEVVCHMLDELAQHELSNRVAVATDPTGLLENLPEAIAAGTMPETRSEKP
jgi:hypothetical protein